MIRIGTSGYSYEHWKRVFYPGALSQRGWLEYYAKHFDTVELNVTFYRLPKKDVFSSWHERTPDDFIFALKGSRFITHIKRLKDAGEPLKLFFRTAKPLRSKIGAVLWQLPPSFKPDLERLQKFLRHLKKYHYRHAFEFRNESCFNKNVFELMKKYGASVCFSDWDSVEEKTALTSDFVYVRRHGKNYNALYTLAQLKKDAAQIRRWHRSHDVFVYFNNDSSGYAVRNAKELKELLKIR